MVVYIWLLLSFIAFVLMGIDKVRAVQNRWRIPEWVLLTSGLLGAAGAISGALLFHHKVAKWRFRIIFTLALYLHIWILWRWC